MKQSKKCMLFNFIFVLMIFTVSVSGAEIHDAVRKGEVERIKAILDKDPLAVNLEDERSWTPLHWAALRGNKELVELLITRGAVVKVSERNDRTPLHYASYQGHQEVVKLLIQKGAIVDAKAVGSASPLNWAAQAGQIGVDKILIDNGADIHAKCKAEVTPLYFAALRGNKDFLELLLSYGAEVNFTDYTGQTPLQVAVTRGHAKVVGILLEKGADKHVKEKHSGRTLLHLAAIYGHTPVARGLLAAGLDPNAKDSKNMTPLDYTAQHNHPEITNLLESKGAGKTGKTILPTTIFFDKKLKQGEAVFWRLHGRSWAVKTKTRFITFSYLASGNIPANPSLASGFLSARQLNRQQVVAFEAYPSFNPQEMTVCKLEENSTKINTHHILNAVFKNQYEKQSITSALYMKPGEMQKVEGMEIAVTPSSIM